MKNSSRITISIKLVFIILILSISVLAGAGGLDTSFDTSVYGERDGSAYKIVEQSDGKLIVGGSFTEAGGRKSYAIARFHPDGTSDPTFNPPDFYKTNPFPGFEIGQIINSVAIQDDGKILVGGDIEGYGATAQRGLFRLNPDGSIDTVMDIGPNAGIIEDIEILDDNKILCAGSFGIIKFNADGTVNSQSNSLGIVYELEVLPNGKIYVSSSVNPGLQRINPDFTTDNSFATLFVGRANSIKTLATGHIIVAGTFSMVNGVNTGRIVKINSDGTRDFSFNMNNSGADADINEIDIKDNGKIVIGGAFRNFNGQSRVYAAQLNSDGTLDTAFETSETMQNRIASVYITSGGAIILGKDNTQFGVEFRGQTALMKVDDIGTIENSFGGRLNRLGSVDVVKQGSDGKIYVGGRFRYANELDSRSIARFNLDGSVDTSFVSSIDQVGSDAIRLTDIEIQPDGKILVSSARFNPGIRRLNNDGSADNTFNSAIFSFVYDIALLPNGKVLIAQPNSLRRLNADGSIDNTFNTVTTNQVSGFGAIDSVTVQPDGKIIIAGSFTQIGGNTYGRIMRLNSDGTLDNTFNPTGGANNTILDVELQPDGKILLVGFFTSLNGSSNQNTIGRLNADGSLDTTFSQSTNAPIATVKLQTDGKILVGGRMSVVGGIQRIGFARLNSDGSLDNSLIAHSPGGVLDIDVQSDNKIIFGGEFLTVNGESNVRVARLLSDSVIPNAATQYDFDGDGSADIGVFRTSANIWYQLLGPNYQFSQTSFGASGDIVAPADFDGDGRTDLAIFRPSNGNWWYLSSVTNTHVNVQFGQNGDIPRPSDFDGDGKADFVVFRPTTSQWLRYGSIVGVSNVNFGLTGDKPLVGDFDGDGKSDVAIYRPSTGDWWWQSSIDNSQRATHWGISTDIPTPGDYDGDGITDFAVYRPVDGVWYIYNSSTQQATIIQFGIAEDKPVPADYDGDGKVDIAVYRPSTGSWYLLRSTAGFQAIQFGISTDIPIPNALIP